MTSTRSASSASTPSWPVRDGVVDRLPGTPLAELFDRIELWANPADREMLLTIDPVGDGPRLAGHSISLEEFSLSATAPQQRSFVWPWTACCTIITGSSTGSRVQPLRRAAAPPTDLGLEDLARLVTEPGVLARSHFAPGIERTIALLRYATDSLRRRGRVRRGWKLPPLAPHPGGSPVPAVVPQVTRPLFTVNR